MERRLSNDPPTGFANGSTRGAFERDVGNSLAHGVVACALLLLGVVYYLRFRTALPPPLEFLRAGPLALEPAARLAWLPSLIHVTAFGLLTFACLRPSLRSAFAAGAAWAAINMAWEFSCAHEQAWLRAAADWLGVRQVPACSYDTLDIAASLAGAAATVGIAWCLIRIHRVSPPTSQERTP